MDHEERGENGKVHSRVQMDDEGKLHGEALAYDDEERLVQRSHWVHGKLDGEATAYDAPSRPLGLASDRSGSPLLG